MEAQLLEILRGSSAENICSCANAEAQRQRLEALAALKFFTVVKRSEPAPVPVREDFDPNAVVTKDEYWKLSRAEKELWQKSKEEERCKINAEQGIDGKALLTKENVERWRSEGKTYGAIAREIVGCSQREVEAVHKGAKPVKVPWARRR